MIDKIDDQPKGVAPTTLQDRETLDLALDLILEALRVNDERLKAIAIEFIGRFGEQPIRRLVLAAANPKNRPGHRVRLLQAVQQLGIGSHPATLMDIAYLAANKNPKVRAAAQALLVILRDRRIEAMGDSASEDLEESVPQTDEPRPGRANDGPSDELVRPEGLPDLSMPFRFP